MSRSCQSATFSRAARALVRTSRASPHTCSHETGLRLWGMALEPFCPSVNGSSASRISVRCSERISRGDLLERGGDDGEGRAELGVAVALHDLGGHGGGARGRGGGRPPPPRRDRHGRRCRQRRRSSPPDRLPGPPQPLQVSPRLGVPEGGLEPERHGLGVNAVGAARRRGVSLWRTARLRRASRKRSRPARRRSAAATSWRASAVSTTSEEVMPMWT